MTPEELRLGNLIQFENKILEVATIGTEFCMLSDGTNTYDAWYDDLQPIPLTEEWLLKFGYEKKHIDLRSNYVPHAYVGLRFESGEFKYYKESDKWTYRVTRIDNPIFIHHLQNLHHVLTGREISVPHPTENADGE